MAIYSPAASPLYREAAAFTGGAELQTTLLARELAGNGLRVAIIVERHPDLPPVHDGVRVIAEVPRAESRNRLDTVRHMLAALREADAGVYVQRAAGTPTGVVGLYARSRSRSFIYSASSNADFEGQLPLSGQERLLFALGLRCARAIVVQNQVQHARASKLGRPRAIRIASFCEPAPPSERDRDSFLWVGRAAAYKNPLAYVNLARALPEARFVMVGLEGGTGNALAREVRAFAADMPNLEIHPSLPREQLLDRYEQAVAVINTSDFEGLPNAFLEGWARGAPALSLNVDPDGVIERFGLGEFADGSPQALTEAAARMWQARDRTDRSAATRSYVSEHHAPAVVGRQWLALIEALRPTGAHA